MKLLIHDLEMEEFQQMFSNPLNDTIVISDDKTIHNCIGCFGCWIKTPAACVVRDKYGDMGEHLSKCEELIIISKCLYGGFSPFAKNVLDRSIPYLHPYFIIKNREMHHKRRYKNKLNMRVCFYGDEITDKEKQTGEKLVRANAINLHANVHDVSFVKNIMEVEEALI